MTDGIRRISIPSSNTPGEIAKTQEGDVAQKSQSTQNKQTGDTFETAKSTNAQYSTSAPVVQTNVDQSATNLLNQNSITARFTPPDVKKEIQKPAGSKLPESPVIGSKERKYNLDELQEAHEDVQELADYLKKQVEVSKEKMKEMMQGKDEDPAPPQISSTRTSDLFESQNFTPIKDKTEKKQKP